MHVVRNEYQLISSSFYRSIQIVVPEMSRKQKGTRLLLLATLVLAELSVVFSHNTIYITPGGNSSCRCISSPDKSCFEWNDYANTASFSSNTTLLFLPGIHVHQTGTAGTTVLRLGGLNNTAFIGSSIAGSQKSIIQCQNNFSFVFYEMTNFSIFNVTFVHCGSPHTSAINMTDVIGLQMEGLSIQNSSREALNLDRISGKSRIKNSSFIGNNTRINPQVSETEIEDFVATAVNVSRSNLSMADCSFIDNHFTGVSFTTSHIAMMGGHVFNNNSGGAMILFQSNLKVSQCSLSVSGNTAKMGGGIRSTASTIAVDLGTLLFSGNNAHYGGGFYLIKTSLVLWNSSATLVGNSAHTGGAVYAILSNISFFSSELGCTDNKADFAGGCIYLLSSLVFFADARNSSFSKNIAWNSGGAIYVDFKSTLFFEAPLSLMFANNSADRYGGALYVQSDVVNDLIPQEPCFFAFHDTGEKIQSLNISLDFIGNTAKSGTVLYGGNIDNCRLPNAQNPTEVFDSLFRFQENNNTIEISSSPLLICSCPFDYVTCTPIKPMNKTIYPGQPILIEFFPSGQRVGPCPAIMVPQVVIKGQSTIILQPFIMDSKCLTYTIPYVTRAPKINIMTQTAYDSKSSKATNLEINLFYRDCPLGFALTMDKGNATAVCACDSLISHVVTDCNTTNGTITKSKINTWIGAISENSTEVAYSQTCLPNQCNNDLLFDPNSPNDQCINGRTGILCSKCPKHSSLTIGIPKCMSCSNYSLLLLIAFAGAGILLVAVLFLINLTVTTGVLNGMLWYAFVVHQNYYFFFQNDFKLRTEILFVFVAWLNLDFGIATCFYDGLDTFQYAFLQLAFPAYVFIIFGLIIICNMCSAKITKLCHSNAVPVLATLAYMSLSKLITMSVSALYPVVVYSKANGSEEQRWVWIHDGTLDYFQWPHILLATTGLLVLLFIILPYGTLLLLAPWLQSNSHRWGLGWINRLKPFLDNYQAPYKDQFRYWTGAMFFLRILLTVLSHALGTKPSNILMVIIVTHVSIMLVAGMTVYRNWRLSVLESFLHINMVCLSSVILLNKTSVEAIWICVGSVLLCFCVVVTYHVIAYLIIPHCRCGRTSLQVKHVRNDDNDSNMVRMRESLMEHPF